jgi:hypothetical protein
MKSKPGPLNADCCGVYAATLERTLILFRLFDDMIWKTGGKQGEKSGVEELGDRQSRRGKEYLRAKIAGCDRYPAVLSGYAVAQTGPLQYLQGGV